MRRWLTTNRLYSVEYAPEASAQLARMAPTVAERILGQMDALAELADLAPIPHGASFLVDDALPPLHLNVDPVIVTYTIDRGSFRIRVTDLAHDP